MLAYVQKLALTLVKHYINKLEENINHTIHLHTVVRIAFATPCTMSPKVYRNEAAKLL